MPKKLSQAVAAEEGVVEEPPLSLPKGLAEPRWESLVATGAGQAIAEDTVQTIVGGVMQRYHDFLVNKEARAYAAGRAADMLQFVVESAFLGHDAGDPNIADDPLWAPGDEPVPCSSESWARGSIPVRRPPKRGTIRRRSLRRPHVPVQESRDQDRPKVHIHASLKPDLPSIRASSDVLSSVLVYEAMQKGLSEHAALPAADSGLPEDDAGEAAVEEEGSPSAGSAASRPVKPAAEEAGHQEQQHGKDEAAEADDDESLSPIERVAKLVEQRNQEERAQVRRALARSGAGKVTYSSTGIVPVFGVNPDRLPRNRVVPVVKLDAAGDKLHPTPPSRQRPSHARSAIRS